MKTKLIIFLFALSPFASIGQNITCSNFCITNIALDTNSANGFDIQISIQMTGDPFSAVYYPHVSSLIDINGDTIATGGLFYFGQPGSTTQDYPVTLVPGATYTPGLVYTAIFIHVDDTCTLTFPCTTSLTDEDSFTSNITLYPNPTTDFITIQSPLNFGDKPAIITIIDQTGRVVKIFESTSGTIQISDLPNGFYTINCRTAKEVWIGKFVKGS